MNININIQVLRGLSVLFVLLFHLDVSYFKFGYIGVDIFFVISGFLMPMILPKYNAYQFIWARVKRLLPVLSIVISLSLLVGYFILLPGEYVNLSLSSLSAFIFLSQFYFIENTGYFDQNAIYQPLLHTWSLGNEFLAYFIVFLSLLILPKKHIKRVAGVLSLISLTYILYVLYMGSVNYLDPIPRFFLFFTAFYISSNREKLKSSDLTYGCISVLSLVIVLTLFGDEIFSKSWPNVSIVLLPLVIIPLMLMRNSFIPSELINRALRKVGDWSYSIYIWHWVLICYERIYFRNSNLNFKEVILLFCLSIILGWGSFVFLERRRKIGAYAFILSLFLCGYIYFTDGASYRTPDYLSNYTSVEAMIDKNYYISKQTHGNYEVFTINSPPTEQHSTIIVGDSHSLHILPIYKSGYSGNLYRTFAQPSSLNQNWRGFTKLLNEMTIDRVIFSFRFHTKDLNDIKALTDNLNHLGLSKSFEIVMLRDIPSFDGDPVACLFSQESSLMYKGCGFDIKQGLPKHKVYNSKDPNWLYLSQNIKPALSLIDSHLALCSIKLCTMMVNKEFIMRDNNHFNENMSSETNYKLYELLFAQ